MDIVVTTIFPPTEGTRAISAQLTAQGGCLWIVGDRKGPANYALPNTRFIHIDQQLQLPFLLAKLLPEKHYARKNLGYLLAIQSGTECLIETDDDNIPLDSFWDPRNREIEAETVSSPAWRNIYRDFSSARIWPRGFPLEEIQLSFQSQTLPGKTSLQQCLIQQGLANDNPDVDAVYRLTGDLPFHFRSRPPVALAPHCWCPFNSQNTAFFKESFPLLYLPSFCSFRMTDIWRSFIAQRCLWEMDSMVAFVAPTMRQTRNDHNLLVDFDQEIPGYLKNEQIRRTLSELSLQQGRKPAVICENLSRCYAALIEEDIFPAKELQLVEAWNKDITSLF